MRVQAHGLRYLVDLIGKQVGGYPYALPHRPRGAYRDTVENTVWVDPKQTGRGFGRALMIELVERRAAVGCRQKLAVIGDSANHMSIAPHASLGFSHHLDFNGSPCSRRSVSSMTAGSTACSSSGASAAA